MSPKLDDELGKASASSFDWHARLAELERRQDNLERRFKFTDNAALVLACIVFFMLMRGCSQ